MVKKPIFLRKNYKNYLKVQTLTLDEQNIGIEETNTKEAILLEIFALKATRGVAANDGEVIRR